MGYQPPYYETVINKFGVKSELYKELNLFEKVKAKRLYKKYKKLNSDFRVCLVYNHIGTIRYLTVKN